MTRAEEQAQLRAENIELAAKTKKSVLSKFMHSQGYQSVPYYEYYRDIFPSGELASWCENPLEQNTPNSVYNGVLLMDTGKTKEIIKQDCYGNDIPVTKKTKSRLMVFDDLYAIDVAVNNALKDGLQSLMSPISYCGRSRTIESERFLYALIIEIDGLKTKRIKGKRENEQSGMMNILHQIKSNLYLSPSYIVCSGSGVHLVWLLKDPMPLFPLPVPKIPTYTPKKRRPKTKTPQLIYKERKGNHITHIWDEFRMEFTMWIWNDAVSNDAIQFEYHGQGFRTVGSIGKKGHLVEVFKICDRRYSMVELFTQPGTLCKKNLMPSLHPPTAEALQSFFGDDTKNAMTEKGWLKKEVKESKKLSERMLEAKEKWPDWYERRIVRKELPLQKGEWDVSRNVYNWYKRLILDGASVGCRYWRLYTLAQYARKCHLPYDELHADGKEIGEQFQALDNGDSLSNDEIEKALSGGYFDNLAPKSAIDFINEKAQLNIQKNPRNGRKRKDHLQADYLKNAEGRPIVNTCKQNRELALQYMRENHEIPGRPEKWDIVHKWRMENPNGRKIDCIRETGLSNKTVYKWWDIAQYLHEMAQ